ncbi:hypothetical protein ACI65C_009117 [Semiaphis heraclei]
MMQNHRNNVILRGPVCCLFFKMRNSSIEVIFFIRNVSPAKQTTIFFLVAVALACIGSAAAQQFVYPATPIITSYYHPYGYTYPLTYNYRFGAYPYLLRR